jgi:RimJ/RimL family protein N-acetyltransferase
MGRMVDVITLPGGRRLRIRALQRYEEGLVHDLFAHLSPRSRYQRFLSPMTVLPEAIARQLTCGDSRRQLGIVAEFRFDTAEQETIGLGNFAAIDDETVEVGLVVRDDWQRQHVGLELAVRTMQAADALGFHRFVANVLNDNVAIRRLINRVGYVVSRKFTCGSAEIAFLMKG